jgi:desulfoferrodoxin-like iron-binding protein
LLIGFEGAARTAESWVIDYLMWAMGGGDVLTKKGQVYVCEVCGNKVEVLEAGAGTLVCCGQNMNLM